ncbi:hypothetical protein ACX40Y_08235 [Sphingomonas sp. RS6]
MGRWLNLAVLISIVAASDASADPLPSARLVHRDAGDCLLVRGERQSSASRIAINGRPFDASGRRGWKLCVPVATIRELALPFARTLDVAVLSPSGDLERRETVRLPVGLLGHEVELASLIVRSP